MTPALTRLAAAHGVATQYQDWADRTVPVAPEAVVQVLGCLGVDATTPAAVEAALRAVEQERWRRALDPVTVVRGPGGEVTVRAAAPRGLWVELESGGRLDLPAPVATAERSGSRTAWTVPLPDLPLGWHTVHGEGESAPLVVAPPRLAAPPGRAWGWMVQLYSLRSARSWAIGDYADLRTLVADAAGRGAGVLLLNPLHAETPRPPINPSPYSPSSRRLRALVYLHVEGTAEYAAAPAEVRAAVDRLRPAADPERIGRDAPWTAKLAALALLWPLARRDAVDAFRAERGPALEQYAVFCALAERHEEPWPKWPADVRHPAAPGVAAAADELAERVAFWCWTQLLVDEQLAGAGDPLRLGLMHDLAVGVDAEGADAWALQDVLALSATVGAPPDSFNQQGQDWGLPPWHPARLRDQAYRPFREVVQGVLRHAGGLRIDHVMGLFRLWWVPGGAGPADGSYVAYDAQALLGILALEAARAGALVVGEDLGTVEPRVREELERTGVLGSAVLWFEQDDDGFLPPAGWRRQAMASVTTHDLPTAAGYLAEEQVRVRAELGQLTVPVETERATVRAERERLLRMLRETGLLAQADGDPVLAMHAALAASPAQVVLAALGDAVGDLRQPNLPGTVDEYPNWRLPLADGQGRPLTLEQLLDAPGLHRLAALLAEGVR